MTKNAEQSVKFLVNIKFAQNATWQGSIHWINLNKKQEFRSALEMIKIMDKIISAKEKDTDVPSFEK